MRPLANVSFAGAALRPRRRFSALVGAAALLVVAGTPSPAAATAPPTAQASAATQPVLVILRDGLASTPATRAKVDARRVRAVDEQNAVLTDLSGPAPTNVHHFVLGNTVAATVTVAQVAALRADQRVADVVLDAPAAAPTQIPAPAAAAAPRAVPAGACTGTAAKGQLEPEGLSVIHARSDNPTDLTADKFGLDGAGVKVAFLADGMDRTNVDFRRANGSSAIVDEQVFGDTSKNGGAEAFGDAGTIAAQGLRTHDLANFVNPAAVTLPGGHCYVRVSGVAPGADVVALNFGNAVSFVPILQAVDYAVTTSHVDVLNESLGVPLFAEASPRNLLVAAITAAAAAGVTVVISSGDAGYNGTIGTPGAAPDVINVGATTHLRAYVQAGTNAANTLGSGWKNDEISAISSSGVTSNERTVDLVAPGDGGWAPCTADRQAYSDCATQSVPQTGADLELFSGTSQSAPFTSGTAALVIQAYRRTHGGANPSPALVKRILMSTATDLGAPADQQGAGRLDARAAAEAALDWTGATATTPGTTAHLIANDGAIVEQGSPGATPAPTTRSFTNTGTTPVAIAPSVRSLDAGTATSTVVPIVHGNAATEFVDGSLNTLYSYATTPLIVRSGQDVVRLSASGVLPTPGDITGPQIAVYDAAGRLTAMAVLQSDLVSRTEVVLSRPAAGTYTVVVYVPDEEPISQVTVASEAYSWRAHPWVSPASAVVPAGQTVTLTVAPPIPAQGGNTADALDLGTAAAATVPVVLSSVLQPTVGTPAPFAVTVRGGNGRRSAPAQTATFVVDVPTGHRQMTLDFSALNCGCILFGTLIDPSGETRSIGSGQEPSGPVDRAIHQTVTDPAAGRWRLVVGTTYAVYRLAPTVPGTGRVSLDAGVPTANSLPTSTSTALVAGRAVIVPVTVTNPGVQPMTVQIDAQHSGSAAYDLAVGSKVAGPVAVALPAGAELGTVLVPPGATVLTASLTATLPVQVSLASTFLGIQQAGAASSAAQPSTVTTAAPAQGIWSVYADEVGPFGSGGLPTGRGVATASVLAPAFDTAVTSPTGSNFYAGVNPATPAGHPVVIAPGGRAVIRVTITPPLAAVGHTVSGRLVVSTPSAPILFAAFGSAGDDVVGTLPYAYRVVAAAQPKPATPQGGGAQLAATGATPLLPLLVAAMCCVLGGALQAGGRRRRRT